MTILLSMLLISFPVVSSQFLMVNKFSCFMIMLTMMVWCFVVSSYGVIIYSPSLMYCYTLSLMMMSTILYFSSINVFIFYVTFESSLILMLFIIVGWGYQVERIQASSYLLMYTVIGSFPLLAMVIMVSQLYSSMNLNLFHSVFKLSTFSMLMISMAFVIKFPIYVVHSWLPKAHVEAPTSGSIVLAAILLKMGSYGVYRVLQISISMGFNNMMMSFLVLVGSILSTIVCIFQSDIKSLIAYSSVSHMTMMYWAMLTIFSVSVKAALLMSLSHGLISSLMFLIAGNIFQIWKTRIVLFINGMLVVTPILAGMFFMTLSMNFSVPPFMSFFSELLIMSSILNWEFSSSVVLGLIIVLSCYYCVSLYSMVSHGKPISISDTKHFPELTYNNMMFFSLIVFSVIFQLDAIF